MGFPTKVQLIKRQASEQWYINFPSALAQAMEFSRGETVEWFVEDKGLLALRRASAARLRAKKNSAGILCPLRATLASVRPRLPPASPRRARPNPRVEHLAVSGTAYRDRSVDHLRRAVS